MSTPYAVEPTVLLEVEEGVATITLNRPDRLNAFAGRMRDDLHDALVAAGDDPEVRVVVIRGAGRGFCTGADVEAMTELVERCDHETFGSLVQAGMRVVRRLRALRQPVIAAVNGPAAGAGASLALACDFRIASDRASLGVTFNRIGLHPDWGATFFLPRLVGMARAMELVMSGRMVGADEGERLGIFQRVVPAEVFDDVVWSTAKDYAAKPPLAMSQVKETLGRSYASTLDEMLAAEHDAQIRCFCSEDVKEGLAAFAEKRPAVFRGT
jgi:2-(1,2-epoxy-1,2-dihydrophenyl)acetyl-CoA isomerase